MSTVALDRPAPGADRGTPVVALNPDLLAEHADRLYRAARGMCRSHHEAEDLVQETFLRVLRRPRVMRSGAELGYLLVALRNTHATLRRDAARRPRAVPMPDAETGPGPDVSALVAARGVMSAIAAVPDPYRDAVVAIDLLGLSYEQAADRLHTSKATITSRVARGRERVVRQLDG